MSNFTDFLSNSRASTKLEVEVEGTRRPRRVLKFPPPVLFYINKTIRPLSPETRRWVRNATDERAAEEYGCRFSEANGMYVVKWQEDNCILYEGDEAGNHLSLDDWQFELTMQTYGWQWFDEHWAAKGGEDHGWIRRFRKVNGWVP